MYNVTMTTMHEDANNINTYNKFTLKIGATVVTINWE